ncbi:MAG: Hsp33 family molecular chaperone HslO [Eubacteriales bacterium]|jgi:molecular chaperone Hsp33
MIFNETKSPLIRAMTRDGSARIFCTDNTAIVNKACSVHQPSNTAAAALGRILTVTSIFGVILKNKDDLITIRYNGDGPAGTIICTGDYNGDVRGYIQNPKADVPRKPNGKLDVGTLIGKGNLNVIRDEGAKEPYVGISPIINGEVGDDITNYLLTSEQTPSVCGVGVRIMNDQLTGAPICTASGGFILQLMPGADEATVIKLEKNVGSFSSVSSMLEKGKTPEDIIAVILDGIEYDLFDKVDNYYKCDCNREKFKLGIKSLGLTELTALLREETGDIETVCHFCGEKYTFSHEEVEKLLDELKDKYRKKLEERKKEETNQ